MEEMKDLKEQLREQRPASWENLPDLALYMDQVLALMEKQTIHFSEDDKLTGAMVNNYIKDGVVPRAEGKRYHAEHLAYLTMTCVLKQVLPVRNAAVLMGKEAENTDIQATYERFCAELSAALNSAADQLPDDLDEEGVAECAMHFALLSYAFGLSCRRMTDVLRMRSGDEFLSRKERKARKKAEKLAEDEEK